MWPAVVLNSSQSLCGCKTSRVCLLAVVDPEAGEVEGRYSKAYEEKINPFSDFRSREKEARRQQMNVLDRIMFEFGQFISGSQ